MDGRLGQSFCWFFLLATRRSADFLFRANSLSRLGPVQHFQNRLARLVSARARGPSRFEPQIGLQILELLMIISSPRIHVRKHKIRLSETRLPEERFTSASLGLIQPV